MGVSRVLPQYTCIIILRLKYLHVHVVFVCIWCTNLLFCVYSCSCFIRDIRLLYGIFLAPIVFVLLFNTLMFIIITRVLIKHSKKKLVNLKNEKDKEQKKRAKGIFKTLLSIVSVMIMFGLSWFFGALSIGEGAIVFQWLFVIFNTTQGFMLFLFFCVIGSDVRDEWKNLLTCNKYRKKKSLTAPLSSMSGNSHSNYKRPQGKKKLAIDSESGDTELSSYGQSYGRSTSTIRRSVEKTLENEKDYGRKVSFELSPVFEPTDHIDEDEVENSFIIENGNTDSNPNTEKPKKPRQLPPHVYIKLKRPTYKVEKITYDDEDGLREKVNFSSKSYDLNVETPSQETNDIVFSNNSTITRDLKPVSQTFLLDSITLSNESATFSQKQVQPVEQNEDAEHSTFM